MGHEKKTKPMAKPKAPVDTNTPKARMSLPVLMATCLPPQTWKNELPIPNRMATNMMPMADVPILITTDVVKTASVNSKTDVSNSQCFRSTLSASSPVNGWVRKAKILYVRKMPTSRDMGKDDAIRYRLHTHSPSTSRCSSALIPTIRYIGILGD